MEIDGWRACRCKPRSVATCSYLCMCMHMCMCMCMDMHM